MPERRPGAASLLAALVGSLLLFGVGAEELDHDTIRALRRQGVIVSLHAITKDAQRRYSNGRVLEAELRRRDGRLIYEIEFLDSAGNMRELYYAAESGELIAYETYEIDADGRLLGIEHDAASGRPLRYEHYITDDEGHTRVLEYDAETGKLLGVEDPDDND